MNGEAVNEKGDRTAAFQLSRRTGHGFLATISQPPPV